MKPSEDFTGDYRTLLDKVIRRASTDVAREGGRTGRQLLLVFDQRPDLDVSPTHTLQRITRLSLLQAASFARVFGPYGVSFGEYLVLAALRRAGPPYRMNPTTLFNSVILSSGAMTNRLDRLEAMGFVERLPDPTDRRGRLVALTDRGRELVDAAVVDHLENEQRLLGALDADEREQLAGLLRKLLLSPPFRELDPADDDSRTRRSASDPR